MQAMRLNGIGDLKVEDIELRDLKENEILLKVEACGICGSDIPRAFQAGAHVMPITIGHEFSGKVVAAANKEDNALIGSPAAVFPIIPCMECENCKTEHYAQCRNYNYLGSRCDGGFAEYCIIPSKWNLVFSSAVKPDFENLCMVEPATVAQHAVRKSQVTEDDVMVIIGAGPIGMMAARWAALFGAKRVVLTEINEEKIAFSKSLGFEVYDSGKDDIISKILEITDGKGADIIIEGTGTSPGLNQAIEMVSAFGRIVLMGNPARDTTIRLANHSQILRKEINLTGVWNSVYARKPVNEWEYTVNMMDKGKLKVKDLITHRTVLQELPELMARIYKREITICKAIYTTVSGEEEDK